MSCPPSLTRPVDPLEYPPRGPYWLPARWTLLATRPVVPELHAPPAPELPLSYPPRAPSPHPDRALHSVARLINCKEVRVVGSLLPGCQPRIEWGVPGPGGFPLAQEEE